MSNILDPHTEQNGHATDEVIPPGVPIGDAGNPKPGKIGAGVDLGAWGRGKCEYPFGEIVKAVDDYILNEIYKIVDARFVSVKSRRHALDFLIREGIVGAADARKDV